LFLPGEMRLVDVGHSGKPDCFTARGQNGGKGQLRAVAIVPLVLRLDHDHAAADVEDQAWTFERLFAAENTVTFYVN